MAKLNGKGTRALGSWIEGFVSHYEAIEVPETFLKWAAITAIGAVLEQKVWMMTPTQLYPNLFTLLVAKPGVGKTRTVRAVRDYLAAIDQFHLAPISMTAASMVDVLVDCRRIIPAMGRGEPFDYNSMLIAADELGTFMSEYDRDTVPLLSAWYDTDPYGQVRRGKDIKIKIKKPQISLLCASTPSNLLQTIPAAAWDQGLMSRMLLIYSDEKRITDIFSAKAIEPSDALIHDLKIINGLIGQFQITKEFKEWVNNWRQAGMDPVPDHPRLVHYCTRRLAHVFKLCMIAAIDRGNTLLLDLEDFHRAFGWMTEFEANIPKIFDVAAMGADAAGIEEIAHFVASHGKSVSEREIRRYALQRFAVHRVGQVIDMMVGAGYLKVTLQDDVTKSRMFKGGDRSGR